MHIYNSRLETPNNS